MNQLGANVQEFATETFDTHVHLTQPQMRTIQKSFQEQYTNQKMEDNSFH